MPDTNLTLTFRLEMPLPDGWPGKSDAQLKAMVEKAAAEVLSKSPDGMTLDDWWVETLTHEVRSGLVAAADRG